jgi:nucleotide-binding universal stress UspA family protein
MYRHLLVPVDCTDDSRQLAHALARFATPLIPCRVTLAAAVPPTDDAELQRKRRRHAADALRTLSQQLLGEGIWTQCRIVEGSDHAAAVAAEATNRRSGMT